MYTVQCNERLQAWSVHVQVCCDCYGPYILVVDFQHQMTGRA